MLTDSPTFFATPAKFRAWLSKNHKKKTALIVGFYKVGTGKPSMTWSESVDQALCFGWIDGIRKSIDKESYLIRFTPRKATSIWSAINIKKMEELSAQGLMQPSGLASFDLRKDHKSKIYSYENPETLLSKEYEKIFKANKKAWKFYKALAPGYRKTLTARVMSAKQETTRLKRLNGFIQECEAGRNILKEYYRKQ
ncbi:MAG: YdeI/OmpD-associated family protein [Saprospiraceae bacterium]